MKALNYKWLLVFFMLWLPLQGATAAILSVCVQEKNSNRHAEKSAVTIDSHHHEGCQKQAADNGTHHVLISLPCDDNSCDAYSNMPIPPGQTVLSVPILTLAVPSLNSGFVSFVPEQPQRPPLLISL
ncbi:hypothetical protein [Nitrosomonas sp.]|uniref:hypothetical protein n=1 Tax=Nitrosomonas sp. TaxID=42353 RepID=UPI0025DBF22D|nr:hypothetical protein [Nitrosomonas sp.]MBV6448198.1 hypothetical protein [Nitrosomonas sp.]